MIFLVVADSHTARKEALAGIFSTFDGEAPIVLDDSMATLQSIEEYVYPSLFEMQAPIVHLKFILSSHGEAVGLKAVKKFAASPTVFIFEEIALPAATIAPFKKHGTVVQDTEKKTAVKKPDLFKAVDALLVPDKKNRWMAYRQLIETNAIEALLGILYWKLRQSRNKVLYEKLIEAQASAWKSGVPLELMIEKVLLIA